MTTLKGCELGPPHVRPNDPFAPGCCCFSLWGTVLACVLARLMVRGVRLCHFLQESTLLVLWWFLKIRTRLVLLWNSTLLWTSNLADWFIPHVCPVEAQALRPTHGFMGVIKILLGRPKGWHQHGVAVVAESSCRQHLQTLVLTWRKKGHANIKRNSRAHAHQIKRGQYTEK